MRGAGRRISRGEKAQRQSEAARSAEGADRGPPIHPRHRSVRRLELGRVEGADDGALADDALSLCDRAYDRLDFGLGLAELAGALIGVEEGVLDGEAHDEARDEGCQRPREPAVRDRRVDRVLQGLHRDEPVEGNLVGDGLALGQGPQLDVVGIVGFQARRGDGGYALVEEALQDVVREGEGLGA